MKKNFTLIVFMWLYCAVAAQPPGAYRAKNSGNWNSPIWEIFDGTNWSDAAFPPDPILTPHIEIGAANNVSVITPVQTSAQVLINNGGTLSLLSDFVLNQNATPGPEMLCSGTLSITAGTFSGTGTAQLFGLMTWGGGILDVALIVSSLAIVNITSSVELRSNLTNDGTVNQSQVSITCTDATISNNMLWSIANNSSANIFNTGGTNQFINSASATINKTGTGIFTNSVPTSNAGQLQIHAGTYVAANSTTNTGTIVIDLNSFYQNNSSTTLNSGSTITGGGTFRINIGTVNVNTPVTFPSTISLDLVAGSTAGSSMLTTQGTTSWKGTTINCPFTNTATGIVNIETNVPLQSIFTNNGTVNQNQVTVSCTNATINNNLLWNITNNNSTQFGNSGGSNQFINASGATVNKNGSGTFTDFIPTTNNGQFLIHGGVFVAGSTTSNAGSIVVDLNSFYQTNNTTNINAGSSFGGFGTFKINAGTVNFNTPITFPSNLLVDLTGGTTGGSSLVTTEAVTNWRGTTLANPWTVDANGRLNVTSNVSLQSTLRNNGIVHVQEVTIGCINAQIINGELWLESINSSNSIANTSGTNQFINEAGGTVQKDGVGTTTFFIPTTNAGLWSVTQGTFIAANTTTNTGSIVININSTYQNNGALALNTGSNITGSGDFKLLSGTMTMNTAVQLSPTMDFLLNGGTTAGTFPLTIDYRMFCGGGTVGSPIVINPQGTMEFSSNTIFKDHVLVKGTINLTSPASLSFENGTLEIDGIFNATATSNIVQLFNTSGTNLFKINSNGILDKFGANILRINLPTIMDGTYKTNDGTTEQNGTPFDISGSLDVEFGKFMKWGGSTSTNIESGASINGSGFYEFQGTTNFNSNLTLPTGSNVKLKAGLWQGSGSISISGSLSWESGGIDIPATAGNGGRIDLSTPATKSLFKPWTIGLGSTLGWSGGTFITNNANIDLFGSMECNPPTGSPLNLQGIGTSIFNFKNGSNLVSANPSGIININAPIDLNGSSTKGVGTINNNNSLPPISNNYRIASGFSPGILTLNSITPLLSNATTIDIELKDGSGPGTGHDQLQRNGDLVLDGTLNVVEIGSVPEGIYTVISLSAGTISGSFDVVNLPLDYTIGQTATTVFVTKNVLPLHLISFSAAKKESSILLTWKTASEDNTSHFEIERSADARIYTGIGRVTAAGYSTTELKYQYTDSRPLTKNNYYRLKMIDQDGKFEFSRIVKIDLQKPYTVRITPNPAADFLMIEGADKFRLAEIIDSEGKLVGRLTLSPTRQQYPIEYLKPGYYIIRLLGENIVHSEKFIKQ